MVLRSVFGRCFTHVSHLVTMTEHRKHGFAKVRSPTCEDETPDVRVWMALLPPALHLNL